MVVGLCLKTPGDHTYIYIYMYTHIYPYKELLLTDNSPAHMLMLAIYGQRWLSTANLLRIYDHTFCISPPSCRASDAQVVS